MKPTATTVLAEAHATLPERAADALSAERGAYKRAVEGALGGAARPAFSVGDTVVVDSPHTRGIPGVERQRANFRGLTGDGQAVVVFDNGMQSVVDAAWLEPAGSGTSTPNAPPENKAPWAGASVEQELAWYGTPVTVRPRPGAGVGTSSWSATLARVFNHGDLVEVTRPDTPPEHMASPRPSDTIRVSTRDYIILPNTTAVTQAFADAWDAVRGTWAQPPGIPDPREHYAGNARREDWRTYYSQTAMREWTETLQTAAAYLRDYDEARSGTAKNVVVLRAISAKARGAFVQAVTDALSDWAVRGERAPDPVVWDVAAKQNMSKHYPEIADALDFTAVMGQAWQDATLVGGTALAYHQTPNWPARSEGYREMGGWAVMTTRAVPMPAVTKGEPDGYTFMVVTSLVRRPAGDYGATAEGLHVVFPIGAGWTSSIPRSRSGDLTYPDASRAVYRAIHENTSAVVLGQGGSGYRKHMSPTDLWWSVRTSAYYANIATPLIAGCSVVASMQYEIPRASGNYRALASALGYAPFVHERASDLVRVARDSPDYELRERLAYRLLNARDRALGELADGLFAHLSAWPTTMAGVQKMEWREVRSALAEPVATDAAFMGRVGHMDKASAQRVIKVLGAIWRLDQKEGVNARLPSDFMTRVKDLSKP